MDILSPRNLAMFKSLAYANAIRALAYIRDFAGMDPTQAIAKFEAACDAILNPLLAQAGSVQLKVSFSDAAKAIAALALARIADEVGLPFQALVDEPDWGALPASLPHLATIFPEELLPPLAEPPAPAREEPQEPPAPAPKEPPAPPEAAPEQKVQTPPADKVVTPAPPQAPSPEEKPQEAPAAWYGDHLIALAIELGVPADQAKMMVRVLVPKERRLSDDEKKVLEDVVKRYAATVAPTEPVSIWENWVRGVMAVSGRTEEDARKLIADLRERLEVSGEYVNPQILAALFTETLVMLRALSTPSPQGIPKAHAEEMVTAILRTHGQRTEEITKFWESVQESLPDTLSRGELANLLVSVNTHISRSTGVKAGYRVEDVSSWEGWLAERARESVQETMRALGRTFSIEDQNRVLALAIQAGRELLLNLRGREFASIDVVREAVDKELQTVASQGVLSVEQDRTKREARVILTRLLDEYWAREVGTILDGVTSRDVDVAQVRNTLASLFEKLRAEAGKILEKELAGNPTASPSDLANTTLVKAKTSVAPDLQKLQASVRATSIQPTFTTSGFKTYSTLLDDLIRHHFGRDIQVASQLYNIPEGEFFARLRSYALEEAAKSVGALIPQDKRERDAYWDLFAASLHKVAARDWQKIFHGR